MMSINLPASLWAEPEPRTSQNYMMINLDFAQVDHISQQIFTTSNQHWIMADDNGYLR